MKNLLMSLSVLLLATGVFAQKKSDDVAKIKSETIDLGNIKQDEPQPAMFEVLNIGTEDLLIEAANPTCGCTIGDYTKDKIAPGKTGFIKATYNAKNVGAFEKHLTVKFAGCDDMKSITIKGTVIAKEQVTPAATETAPIPLTAPKAEVATEKKTETPAKTATKTATKTTPAKTTKKP
jgi:hypothetical protein